MRRFTRLFGKLTAAERHQHEQQERKKTRISDKLNQASATLSQTTQKLDHLAGDFDSRASDATRRQAA
jgi:hypothetical protein